MNSKEFREQHERLLNEGDATLLDNIEYGKIIISDFAKPAFVKPFYSIFWLLLLWPVIGWILLYKCRKRYKKYLKIQNEYNNNPDAKYITSVKNSFVNTCWDEYYTKTMGYNVLQYGFTGMKVAEQGNTFSNLFYKEKEDKSGFDIICVEPLKIGIEGGDGRFYFSILLPDVRKVKKEFELTKDNIFKMETKKSYSTGSSGGLLGAAVGAGVSKLMGGSALTGAVIGASNTSYNTVENVQTIIALKDGSVLFFNDSNAYIYFTEYFKDKE